MTYKGYDSIRVDLDEEAGTISGEVDLARGVATFEGRTVAEAAQAFRDTVDDYLAMCAERGIEPERPIAAEAPARSAG